MDYRKNNHIDPWDDRVYGTGRTEPPKNNSGIIALLLIVVIFLSGIVSALSFLNIKLFQQLQQQELQHDSVPMVFSDIDEIAAAPTERSSLSDVYGDEESSSIPILGLTGNQITQFDQYYFHWPAGLLITQVEEGSKAEALGIETGDILISINDTALTSREILDDLLKSDKMDNATQIVIYRDGNQYSLTLTE